MHINSRLEGPTEMTRNEETDETARLFRLYTVSYHVHRFSASKLVGVGTFCSSQNSSL